MVNLPQVHLGGVRVGDGLATGSLILTTDSFFLKTVQIFFGGGRVAAALHLPARVLKYSALGPVDESSAHSTLGVRAETGTAGISESPSKMGMGAMKLSRAY
jgi:hypothetical protein